MAMQAFWYMVFGMVEQNMMEVKLFAVCLFLNYASIGLNALFDFLSKRKWFFFNDVMPYCKLIFIFLSKNLVVADTYFVHELKLKAQKALKSSRNNY